MSETLEIETMKRKILQALRQAKRRVSARKLQKQLNVPQQYRSCFDAAVRQLNQEKKVFVQDKKANLLEYLQKGMKFSFIMAHPDPRSTAHPWVKRFGDTPHDAPIRNFKEQRGGGPSLSDDKWLLLNPAYRALEGDQ